MLAVRMILECSHCGAPLDVGSASGFTKCNYCGRTSRTRNLKTQHAVTPQGWAPPPQWLPPPQYTIHVYQPMPYKKGSSAAGCIALAILLIPVTIAVGGGVWAAAQAKRVPSRTPAETPAEAETEAWDGTSTLRCDGSEKIKVSGIHMSAPLAEVVVADGSCSVVIEDSTLKGDTVIRVDGSAKVMIRRGSIDAGRKLAELSSNTKLEIEDAKISIGSASAEEVTGVAASMSSEVTLARDNVTIKGKDPMRTLLVDLGMRAKARLVDGHYDGDFTVKAGSLSEVRKEGGDIEARLDVSSSAKAVGFKDSKPKPKSTKSGSKSLPPSNDPLAPSFEPQHVKCNCPKGDLACNMKCSAKK
ncbi:MAG: hypothetical protein HOV80_23965 [Polyangiaceae bacterium]|nr:hypothetical protein [Polyangiaceae bacterium]